MDSGGYFSVAALRGVVWVALFCALIIVGSYVAVPLPFSPVPITLQSFFVLLAALVVGVRVR